MQGDPPVRPLGAALVTVVRGCPETYVINSQNHRRNVFCDLIAATTPTSGLFHSAEEFDDR